MKQTSRDNRARDSSVFFALAVSLAAALLAISNDSLWIDEANSALKAMQPTLLDWWRVLLSEKGSDAQMPFYMLYLWGWEKIAGYSEWALRAANVPFFVLGQWALFRSLRHNRRLAFWTAVVGAASPFLWSYLAEARPYAMQFGGACLVVAGLIQLTEKRPFATHDLALFCAGLVILCGSSALAFPWAGMGFLTALVLVYQDKTLASLRLGGGLLLAITGLLMLLIFGFDVWVTGSGAKASAVGTTGFFNVLLVGYELLGFAGLGPGRLQLRESQSLAALTPYLFALCALALALAIALLQWRRLEKSLRTTFLLYSVVPLIFVGCLAGFASFRLLGRHIMPLAPVIVVALASVAHASARWGINRWFIPIWLASALLLRFHPRHQRDDYRGAAAEARSALARGETVWWSADAAGAKYYQVPTANSFAEYSAMLVVGPSLEDLQTLPAPDVVVASKPDIFDSRDAIRTFVAHHAYSVVRQLPAFTIWRKTPDPAAP